MPTKFNELLIGAIALVLTIIFVIVIMVLHLYSEQGSTMSWLP
jgi:NADH:ubiquinone oxidoreductase subunit 3 (subunit A)